MKRLVKHLTIIIQVKSPPHSLLFSFLRDLIYPVRVRPARTTPLLTPKTLPAPS